MANAFRIDPVIASILPELSPVELNQLEKEIREARRVNTPVTVWENPNDGDPTPILIDGHTRHRIHTKLIKTISLPSLKIERMNFPDRLEAIKWMMAHQDGRRNWTGEQRAWAMWKNQELVDEVKRASEERRKRKPKNLKASNAANKNKGKKTAEVLAEFTGGAVSASTMERVKRNTNKILKSGNKEIIRKTMSPANPDERMSFSEGAKFIQNEAEQAKRRAIQVLSNNYVLPPLDPALKGTLDVIHTADVLAGLDMVADNSVHLSASSPPYPVQEIVYQNIDANYRDYRAWLDLMEATYRKIFAKTISSGRTFVQFDTAQNRDGNDPERAYKNVAKLQMANADFTHMMRDIGFNLGWEKAWYKQNSIGHRPNYGTKFSPENPTTRRQHEYILGFHKGPASMRGLKWDKNMIDIYDDEFVRFVMSHWYIIPEKRLKPSDPAFHPAPFPVLLAYAIIRLFSFRGMTVLDPFSGSGTVAYVARALGRRFIGIDNGPGYNEAAQKRIATLDGLTAQEMMARLEITPEILTRLNSHMAIEELREIVGRKESTGEENDGPKEAAEAA